MFRHRRRVLSCAAAIAGAAAAGCIGPSKNVREGECLVAPTFAGVEGASATVKGNRASTQGFGFTREIAELRDDGVIVYLAGESQTEAAAFRDGRLTVKAGRTAVSEPITDGVVRIAQGGGERTFKYSDACTPAQAALGTYALIQSEVEHGGS